MTGKKVINNKLLFVGMDLHKNSSTFCVKNPKGLIVDQQKVRTAPKDITKYLNGFKEQAEKVSLVLEPVSQWYFYADLIENLDIDVHLAHSGRVKAIASARIKTDKIDSAVLCDLLRGNLLPESYFSSLEVRSWKELTRFRASLVNLRTQTKNKIHSILHKNALICEFTDLFGKSGRIWLDSLSLEEYFQISLDNYLKVHDHLTELIADSEKRIESMINSHEQAKLLTTIPGVSYVSALTIMAEIGDINRFPSKKQLMSYAGLVPSTYASGDKVIHGRITKQGSKWLRWIMVEIAHRQVLCKRKPGFSWYYRKTRKNKGTATAAVATARKLLAVVWAMLRTNSPYEPRVGSSRQRPKKYRP